MQGGDIGFPVLAFKKTLEDPGKLKFIAEKIIPRQLPVDPEYVLIIMLRDRPERLFFTCLKMDTQCHENNFS
jgi:hypothetical protein